MEEKLNFRFGDEEKTATLIAIGKDYNLYEVDEPNGFISQPSKRFLEKHFPEVRSILDEYIVTDREGGIMPFDEEGNCENILELI